MNTSTSGVSNSSTRSRSSSKIGVPATNLQTNGHLRILAMKKADSLARQTSTTPTTSELSLSPPFSTKVPEWQPNSEEKFQLEAPATSLTQSSSRLNVHAFLSRITNERKTSEITASPDSDLEDNKSDVESEALPENPRQRAPSPDYVKALRLNDIREQLDDMRMLMLKLQQDVGEMSIGDGAENGLSNANGPSILSMAVMDKETASNKTGRPSGAHPKEHDQLDKFFSTLFIEKVPKALLDMAQKQNAILLQRLDQQQVDFKRYQSQQAALVDNLLKKHEVLQSRVLADDYSYSSDHQSDSGKGSRVTVLPNHDDAAFSDITSASQLNTSLRSKHLNQITGPLADSKEPKRDYHRAEVHPPPGSVRSSGLATDNERLEFLLYDLKNQMGEDRQELSSIVRKSQKELEKDKNKLVKLTKELQKQIEDQQHVFMTTQKHLSNSLNEVMKKMLGIERTQAILAENVWRH